MSNATLEHDPTKLDQLRCVVARRPARRGASCALARAGRATSDAGPSVERRNAAGARVARFGARGARDGATLRAGAFCGAGSSQGSPVGPATRFAPLLPATQNSSGATGSTWSDHALDVLGIGNAIVDVIANADDTFLIRHGLDKGAMRLIDEATAEQLYGDMGPGLECSGGSAANTMVAFAALGGRAGYIGKVKDDLLGKVFAHDIRAAGVSYGTKLAADGAATARCLILVTPDAQRTMNTFLGASTAFGPADLDGTQITSAKITYLEGYLWDKPAAKQAFRQALTQAHEAGRRVALTLSDAFCVERHRAEFRALVEHDVDVLFANEAEIRALYQVDEFDKALQKVRGHCEIAALTRSEKGAVVVRGAEVHVVDAAPVARLVDSTGAGDFYAAGFLYGLTHDFDLARCGRLGALAAAEVISHFGARPEAPLTPLVEASAKPLKRR